MTASQNCSSLAKDASQVKSFYNVSHFDGAVLGRFELIRRNTKIGGPEGEVYPRGA